MEIFNMRTEETVKLNVSISSDAVVGSNVSLNQKVVKKSASNVFTVTLGKSDILKNAKIAIVSNFMVHNTSIESIIQTTEIIYTLKSGNDRKRYRAQLVKINANIFMGYTIIDLLIENNGQ